MVASANFLMNKLNSLGGAFIDLHAVRCGVCVIGVEICAVLLTYGLNPSRDVLMRKLLIQWPVLYVTFALIGYLGFDWRPGVLAVPLYTV